VTHEAGLVTTLAVHGEDVFWGVGCGGATDAIRRMDEPMIFRVELPHPNPRAHHPRRAARAGPVGDLDLLRHSRRCRLERTPRLAQ